MPVIRQTVTTPEFKKEQRDALVQQLASERAGKGVAKGPVIFEIPLGAANRLDILVVWEAWKDLPSETRSDVILEAYKDQKEEISQALGVTYQEAVEQHVLPYAVQPMTRKGEVDPGEVKAAMLKHGGIELDGDKVSLRLPTMVMAEQVHRELWEEMPKGCWSIVQSVNPPY